MDGKGKELVAFGKGIGFPKMPYEVSLESIDRTFYNVDEKYLTVINEIPIEITQFTSEMLDLFKADLPYDINPNTPFTLADHLAFCVKRYEKGMIVKMPLAYEMEHDYPVEMDIATKILALFNRRFHLKLPKREIAGIAMNLINNRYDRQLEEAKPDETDFEEILEQITSRVEEKLQPAIKRNGFSYFRFTTHMKYLVERLKTGNAIVSDNEELYEQVKAEYPQVSECVDEIADYLTSILSETVTEEEKLYMIMHVNRLCEKESI
jgi:beta-glucoside operon transcriptional antiterminator